VIVPLASKYSASDTFAPPAPGELHLWLCHRRDITDSQSLSRQILAAYCARQPQSLRFTSGEFGKPVLAYPPGQLEFNMSHSGDWFAFAVCSSGAVGVDLEYCASDRDVMKLARRCYTCAEIAELEACPAAIRVSRFYAYWTLREASVKARGASLARELQATGFGLAFPAAEQAGRIAVHGQSAGQAWYGLLEPLPAYTLALCCSASGGSAPALEVRQWQGGGSYRVLPAMLRAQSQA
jgi:4'-phosphopantetheinyl transferase